MANKILDLCLDVKKAGVVVSLARNEKASNPVAPPYVFQIYRSSNDWDPTSGTSVTVNTIGKCRIVAWDSLPSHAPEANFTEQTWMVTGVLLTIDGGENYSIGTASTFDPWPPT